MNKMNNLQEFEQWLANSEADLEHLKANIPRDIKLDYSIKSVSQSGKWIVSICPEADLIEDGEVQKLVSALARYVGEVFRKEIGGNWFLELNHEKVYQGYIGIKGYEFAWNEAVEEFPIAWVSAAIHSQDSEFILRRINNHQKRV